MLKAVSVQKGVSTAFLKKKKYIAIYPKELSLERKKYLQNMNESIEVMTL